MKKIYSQLKFLLAIGILTSSSIGYSQGSNNEPRFETFHIGQAFTSITSDSNKNVWAGTTSQGLFFLDQTAQDPVFSVQILGTAPVIGSLRIQSMAKDRSGNIWIGHGGVNTSNGQGGVERVNVNTLEVQHFSPDRDALGFQFLQRDGIATLNAQQLIVDPNNKVWIAHRYHDLTVTGTPSSYILTPGTFSFRDANATGPFESVNTWKDVQDNTMREGLPYPAYTYNPTPSQTAQSRTCNAISVDRGFVYVSVFGYGHIEGSNTYVYNRPRIIKYTSNAQYITEYTTQDARFNNSNGIFHGVYANNNKGLWVTTPNAGNGFSVLRDGIWYNVTDSNIIPPNTVFNKNAIWGDSNGKVYLGTNNGLLVYDGSGEVFSPYAYTLYTKVPYNSPLNRAVHDPDMLSNNIIAGCIESNTTENYSWIATSEGIMRVNLPVGDIFVYHVKEKEQPYQEVVNGIENYDKFATLKSTHIPLVYVPISEDIPSFAVDGTTSSILRLKTDDPGGYYAQNSLYRIELRKYTSDPLIGDVNSPEYIAQYGKFSLKPLINYEGQPDVQDLKYVDFIYQHPTYIKNDDFVTNKHYTEYDVFVFKRTPQQTDEPVFRHPIKLSLPPVLFGHGVWSDVGSLQKFDSIFKTKGYSENETSIAWRLNGEMAENHFFRDAHIIPTYIDGLINKALGSKVSAGKVNMIVHSRGGLYTRAYIEELKPDIPYKDNINALVTLNTPHFGSQAANGILDKRILLTGLQKTLLVSSTSNLFSNLIDEIQFGPSDPLRIGDIFGLSAPKLDRVDNYGARNLIVENDYISGGLDASTWFIPKLNSASFRQKMVGIPFHAVATNFSVCEIDPLLCNDNLLSSPILRVIPKRLIWVKVLESSTKFLLNTLPSGIDNLLNYVYNGPSDAIVPRASMRAGLADQYISPFSDLNVCHVDTGNIGNSSGVTTNFEIQLSVFSKLKQKFNDSNSNFTKNGITNPPSLNYTFLAGFQGQQLRGSQNNFDSKIVINPNSFLPALESGVTSTFDVYQENVDRFIVYINSNKEKTNAYYFEKSSDMDFRNTITFDVPNEIFGNITITAIGFKNGEMVAQHEIERMIDLPVNLALQSIRFAESRVEIAEKNQHQFKLLGLFSDNIEREINDLTGITYTIENNSILSRSDFEIIVSNIPGQSKFTASINGLTAVSEYIVVEDIALRQTIIADYFANYDQTGPIDLKWKSLIEYNSSRFTLERSIDNIGFTEIDQQNAQGTSYDIVNYSFSDDATDNLIYYRLRTFDIYNNIVFEETIVVNRNLLTNPEFGAEKSFVIYPNPVTSNSFSVSLKGMEKLNSCDIKIYNVTGHLVFEQSNLSTQGNDNLEVKMPFELSNGIYIVQLKNENFIKSEKLIIQH